MSTMVHYVPHGCIMFQMGALCFTWVHYVSVRALCFNWVHCLTWVHYVSQGCGMFDMGALCFSVALWYTCVNYVSHG